MNKTEMIAAIAEEYGMEKDTVDTAVSGFLNMIVNAVAGGDKVQLMGFGTFESKVRPARETHHPKTGETIQVPESKVAVFKPGKNFKQAVK